MLAGALILSSHGLRSKLELKAAESDSRRFQQFCAKAEIKVDTRIQHVVDVTVAKAKVESFLSEAFTHYFICGIFHGVEGTGAWKLRDGELHFEDIADIWVEMGHDVHISSSLFILCDSCFSGSWARKAAKKQIGGISVQASCADCFPCTDNEGQTFTVCWCEAQLSRPDKDWQEYWKPRLAIQQPVYYHCKRLFVYWDQGSWQTLVGIGEEQSCTTDPMSVVRRPDHSGVFTKAISGCLQDNFTRSGAGSIHISRYSESWSANRKA